MDRLISMAAFKQTADAGSGTVIGRARGASGIRVFGCAWNPISLAALIAIIIAITRKMGGISWAASSPA
jgi:hypothetical protein